MFRKIFRFALVIVLMTSIISPAVLADYEDGMDCPVCGEYHWDDSLCCPNCGKQILQKAAGNEKGGG